MRRAMAAKTAATRAKHARAGLAQKGTVEPTTQAMLLRQLYLALFEARKFERALVIASQALALDVLPDVLHQDAARAAFAAGDVDAAVSHLRSAARRGPASRRAFHLWTLGSTLFLAHRYPEAIAALSRAVRWSTREKPLYRAHLALARIAGGEEVRDVAGTIDELAEAACGQGYGRFVLGHLAYALGHWSTARSWLEAFVKRVAAGKSAMSIALEPEVHMARATLKKMSAN